MRPSARPNVSRETRLPVTFTVLGENVDEPRPGDGSDG